MKTSERKLQGANFTGFTSDISSSALIHDFSVSVFSHVVLVK